MVEGYRICAQGCILVYRNELSYGPWYDKHFTRSVSEVPIVWQKEVDEPQQQLIWMLNLVQIINVIEAKIAKASILTISHHQISTSLVHTTYGFCFQWSSSLVSQTKKHSNGEKKTIKFLKWIVVTLTSQKKPRPISCSLYRYGVCPSEFRALRSKYLQKKQ